MIKAYDSGYLSNLKFRLPYRMQSRWFQMKDGLLLELRKPVSHLVHIVTRNYK